VELEEIDPMTGMPIAKTNAMNPVAGYSVEVGGVRWAYRASEPDASVAGSGKPTVLLLHGLGSSSYSFRNTLGLLGAEGYTAIAPDWPGHGDSDKPANFDFSEAGYTRALDGFIAAAGIKGPVALVVQGFILPQYALLWALANEGKVERLMVLNTPLATSSKLRPELAAYKNPVAFMRPKGFAGDLYNASGSAYVMERKVADVYAKPYSEPGAVAAVAATMDKVDFGKLLAKVNDGFRSWRRPSVVLFGGSDPFIPVASAFEFLEDKRTNMKVVTAAAKLGHMPQEDFAEAIHQDAMLPWLRGDTDAWSSGKQLKMTKKGAVEV